MPAMADQVAAAAEKLSTATTETDRLAAKLAGTACLTTAVSICHDVHDALRRTVETLNECGEGLVAIAQDFARTDADVHAAFEAERRTIDEVTPPDTTPATVDDIYESALTETEDPTPAVDDLKERDDALRGALPDQDPAS